MMKLVLLVAICGFATVLCETHQQQMEYANSIIEEMEYDVQDIKRQLKKTDESTEEQRNLMLMHAYSFNFNVHFVLDSLQHVVSKYAEKSRTLQEVVMKLNDITNELEKSFENEINAVKIQLVTSLENILVEAKHLRQIIHDNSDLYYTSTLLRFIDNLESTTQNVVYRIDLRRATKASCNLTIRMVKAVMIHFLSTIRSEDVNVYKDFVRYLSKASSEISQNAYLLKDLMFTYKTKKYNEVQEILNSLGQLVQDNEKVLYNANSFPEIKNQMQVTIVKLADQLTKIVNAGFSDDGNTVEDENLIYVFLPEMIAQASKLHRNMVKTSNNYIDHHDSDF